MVSQVTLGNFFTTSSGQTVLGGVGGSGLDTQALINTLTTAKGAQAKQDQDQITLNNKQSSALTQFQTLLSTFQSAADALRNPPGVDNEADNVFDFTTASVTASDGSNAANYLTVTTQAGAALQSYDINGITQLATGSSQTTGQVTASSGADGSFLTTGGDLVLKGTNGNSTITLNAGDSLDTIAGDFNAVSGNTGITATVVQIDSTHFTLSFASTSTGTSSAFDFNSPSTVISDASSFASQFTFNSAVSGQDAKFSINNIPIDRPTNNIDDVISGVTFNLLQKTPTSPTATSLTVNIQPDTTTVQNSIVNFVTAYNAIKTFAVQQTQLNSDGTYASTAVLAGNQTFRSTINNLTTEVTSQVTGLSSGAFSSLADVGITLTNQPASSTTPEVDNILNVDDNQLSSSLATNYQGVMQLFGFNMTSNNANLKVFAATNALNVAQFTLNIDPTSNTFTATYNGGADSTTLTATALPGNGGYVLTGAAGSVLEGLQLIYASTSAATISVNSTQGIADQMYNTSNAATTANTGTIPVALTALQTSDTSLNNDITKVNAQVAQYQQQLLQEFSALEQTVSNVNNLLDSLSANDQAKLEDSQVA